MYKKVNNDIRKKIHKLISEDYQQAALGTITSNGYPLVTKIIPLIRKSIIYLLVSDLSEHTHNISTNPNISLYFAAQESHKSRLNNERVSILGAVRKIKLEKTDTLFTELLNQYILIEPGAAMWAHFSDFNFYQFEEHRLIYIEGFAKAYEHKSGF